MRTNVFIIRRSDGKVAAQHLTKELADREIRWLLASGATGPFTIEQIERVPSWGNGIGAPNRSGGRWPSAKDDEFRDRYGRGDPVSGLAQYFGTSVAGVCKTARRLGFRKRIDDPRTFERHRGRWTGREEELINTMYDEGTSVRTITKNIPRTTSAVEARLTASAPTLSTRSQFGRFIVRPGSGRHGIYPVLEEASESDDDSY